MIPPFILITDINSFGCIEVPVYSVVRESYELKKLLYSHKSYTKVQNQINDNKKDLCMANKAIHESRYLRQARPDKWSVC